jgi:hypothetical protein
MALLAQGLPIALVPEELWITTVWNYVVYNRSFGHLPFLQALYAKGMRLQKYLSGFLPSGSVSAFLRIVPVMLVQGRVFIAVLLAVWH